ncbi:hypothetical protein JW851_01930 [Candidatus Woesearchaeota archaeon]|nr:hypothetical protein [Candidatus Woesearchaeota archaeon]
MEFQTTEKSHPNIRSYSTDDFKLAKEFAEKIHKELEGGFLKAAILFGSTARKEKTYHEPDIDILLIINDLTMILSPEVVEAYRVITRNVASKVSKRLHITTFKLTSFWDYLRNGDPVSVNILRDGVPLYDCGFFEPAQALLFQGRIRPTKESVWTYFTRAPNTIKSSEWHLLQASIDLYWAVIDAAHAALMHYGEVPPSPSHVSDLIYEKLVKKKICSRKEAETMRFFYELSKKITHRQKNTVTGKEYDAYLAQAKQFVDVMKRIISGRK